VLYLCLQLGRDAYLVEARRVVEVLPLVQLKHVPQAPPALSGVFQYRGQPVPLIDLSQLALGVPARRWFSTRILLLRDGTPEGGRLCGLIAEKVTRTRRFEPGAFADPGTGSAAAAFLGPVVADGTQLLQLIDADRLLLAVAELLGAEAEAV
jgi:chemotaxis-related protein WspB